MATYTYNELGQVKKKLYGATDQKQDYEYNIRGWLTKINDPSTTADYFAMRLGYETPDIKDVVEQYGGNISSMVWRTQMDGNSNNKPLKGYGFSYDGLDRLKAGNYAVVSSDGSSLIADESYTERITEYDANGNIRSLTRKDGSRTATTYASEYSGNQLLRVNGGTTFQYDANGNATTDGRNGFTIAYNELNLPKSVSKYNSDTKKIDEINYTYDATGAKLAVTNPDGTARYYLGSMVYDKDKKLDYVLHEEGTIKATTSGTSTTYTYQYFLKDHLGNTRVMFSKPAGVGQTPSLAQAIDYYPFGKSFDNVDVGSKNRYLYNGKEIQEQSIGGIPFGWYDYGARFYDPEIGRWHSVDPLAEDSEEWSSYAYVDCNPIRYNDPDGCKKGDPNDPIVLPEVVVTANRPWHSSPTFIWFVNFFSGGAYDRAMREIEFNITHPNVIDRTMFQAGENHKELMRDWVFGGEGAANKYTKVNLTTKSLKLESCNH